MNCYKQPKRTLKTCESNKFSKTTITIHFNRLQVCAIQASFCVCCVIYTCTSSEGVNGVNRLATKGEKYY